MGRGPSYYPLQRRPHFSLGAILAILAALGSLIASCGGHGILGLVLGIVSVPLGLGGILGSSSPQVRGGIVSFLAIGLGIAGVILAIVVLVFHIVLFPFR